MLAWSGAVEISGEILTLRPPEVNAGALRSG
jgi:hypothetical protein